MGVELPKGMRWEEFSGSGVFGWFLIDDTRYNPAREKEKLTGNHYVIGIFRYDDRISLNLYCEGRTTDSIEFPPEPLTTELRDTLLPIGLMNRIDI